MTNFVSTLIFSDHPQANALFFPAAFRVTDFSRANGVYLCWGNDIADFSHVANGYVEYGYDGSANFFRRIDDEYIRIEASFTDANNIRFLVEFYGRDLQYQLEAYANIFAHRDRYGDVYLPELRTFADAAFAIACRQRVPSYVVPIIKKRLSMVLKPMENNHWYFLSPMEHHEETVRQFELLEQIFPTRLERQ